MAKKWRGGLWVNARENLRKIFARFVLTLVPFALSISLAVALSWASYAFAMQNDLFVLRQVTIENGRALTPDLAWRFAGLRGGTPIFDINLSSVERIVRARNPEYKNVWVRRVLPGEIRIHLVRRAPIAQVQSGAFFLVDSEGMVISQGQGAPFNDLAVILGSKSQIAQLKKGARVNRVVMSQGIQLLKDVRRFDVLHGQRLSAIDISNPDNLVLWVNEKIEVRISSRNLTSQMKKISEALANIDLDPERVKYVDLRFDDIVIGPRS